MFHKTVYNAWNIFKHLWQLSENSAEIQFSRVSIDWEESSMIEISFQSIKQESNTDRIKPRHHDIIPNHFEVFSFFLV